MCSQEIILSGGFFLLSLVFVLLQGLAHYLTLFLREYHDSTFTVPMCLPAFQVGCSYPNRSVLGLCNTSFGDWAL